jgi:hypothetical protein
MAVVGKNLISFAAAGQALPAQGFATVPKDHAVSIAHAGLGFTFDAEGWVIKLLGQ